MNISLSAFLLLTLLPLVAIVATLVGATRRSRRLVFDEAGYPGLAQLRSATLGARRVGLLLGVAAFVLVLQLPAWLPALAPVTAGAILVITIMVGQWLAYRSAQAVGVAAVERRTLGDYLPRREVLVGAVVAALLAVSSAVATLSATADDSGEQRLFSFQCVETWYEQGTLTPRVTRGWTDQFPGGYYQLPLWLGLLALVGLGAVALVLIVRRPRNGTDPELVRVDDALRRQSAEGVVGAVGLAFAASLVGLLYRAGAAVAAGECDPVLGAISFSLGIAALVALLPTCWFAVRVLVPGDGSPAKAER